MHGRVRASARENKTNNNQTRRSDSPQGSAELAMAARFAWCDRLGQRVASEPYAPIFNSFQSISSTVFGSQPLYMVKALLSKPDLGV